MLMLQPNTFLFNELAQSFELGRQENRIVANTRLYQKISL